jgi:hypothetical protein
MDNGGKTPVFLAPAGWDGIDYQWKVARIDICKKNILQNTCTSLLFSVVFPMFVMRGNV